jgi:hypothetical protein
VREVFSMRTLLCCASLVALMLGCAAPAQTGPKTRTVDKLSAEEESKMDCHYETPTGSHLQYKVCRTKAEKDDDRDSAERLIRSAPPPRTENPHSGN